MEINTILIKGVPFTYEDEINDITNDNNTPISIEDAKDLLQKTKILFGDIGLQFSLAFGTLLGAVRDKGIIKGDEDVDIFIWDEDVLFNNLQYLKNNNFKLCRFVKGRLYSFRVNNRSYIDVYIKRPLGFSFWSIYCTCLYDKAVPRSLVSEFEEIEFLDGQYLVPKKPERLLEFYYGKSWRIPVKSHKFIYEVKSRYYWKYIKSRLNWQAIKNKFFHNRTYK